MPNSRKFWPESGNLSVDSGFSGFKGGKPKPNPLDEHHKAFKDPLHVPVGPITKARSKNIKEALNGLIQEIWADSNTGRSKLGPKEDEGIINLIQAIEG